MKTSFQQGQDEFNTSATNISAWEKQIKELRTKIQKGKDHQQEIQQLDRKTLDEEATMGVYHVE